MRDIELLKPKLNGPRFQDHAVPLDLLKDFAVLEEFVIAVAKAEWRHDNPDRQRTPRGFMADVSVKLKRVEPGSAVLVLAAFIATPASLFPDAEPPQLAYLERARGRIVEAIAAAEQGRPPAEHLPPQMLAYFDRFGRGLRAGESISFDRDGGQSPARLTPRTRRTLVLAAPDVQTFTSESVCRGAVVATNDSAHKFTIRLPGGQEVPAPLATEHRDAVLDAQKKAPGGVRVAVRGIGRYTRADRLVSLEEVEDVTLLEPLDVPARLDELRLLKAGWLDGDGKSLDGAALDKLGHLFAVNYPGDLPLPYTYPTEDGGIQFEWRLQDATPEIEIDLASFEGEWLSNDDEATIDLSAARGWADLAERVGGLAGANPNGESA